MSYVSPKMRPRFETLSVDLKNEILRRDVRIETLHDLIAVLEQIVQDGETAPYPGFFPLWQRSPGQVPKQGITNPSVKRED